MQNDNDSGTRTDKKATSGTRCMTWPGPALRIAR